MKIRPVAVKMRLQDGSAVVTAMGRTLRGNHYGYARVVVTSPNDYKEGFSLEMNQILAELMAPSVRT